MARRGGTIQFKIDGINYDAKGDFTYNLGSNKREPIIGVDGLHGFKDTIQPARIEGEITDKSDLDVKALQALESVTVTLELANGKVFILRDAFFSADGDINTGEGNIQISFHGIGEEDQS